MTPGETRAGPQEHPLHLVPWRRLLFVAGTSRRRLLFVVGTRRRRLLFVAGAAALAELGAGFFLLLELTGAGF